MISSEGVEPFPALLMPVNVIVRNPKRVRYGSQWYTIPGFVRAGGNYSQNILSVHKPC